MIKVQQIFETACVNTYTLDRIKVLVNRLQEDIAFVKGANEEILFRKAINAACDGLNHTVNTVLQLLETVDFQEQHILELEKNLCRLQNPDWHNSKDPTIHHPCLPLEAWEKLNKND